MGDVQEIQRAAAAQRVRDAEAVERAARAAIKDVARQHPPTNSGDEHRAWFKAFEAAVRAADAAHDAVNDALHDYFRESEGLP